MTGTLDPVRTVEVALPQIERLLVTDAALATEQAAQILGTVPGHLVAMLFLGIARRFTGDAAGSLEALEPLARSQPNWAAVHYELGRSCAAARYDYATVLHQQMRSADALREIDRALEADPRNASYRNLQAVLLDRIGEFDRADDTETEVRRLLDYCGLPFDERCLRFHENDRAIRTSSSEQPMGSLT
ncbi:MAG: hypothetical protein IIA11_03080 [Proteobacteria bacterium]|nr:hypothetical protein [Pseudomonadota bacterium]